MRDLSKMLKKFEDKLSSANQKGIVFRVPFKDDEKDKTRNRLIAEYEATQSPAKQYIFCTMYNKDAKPELVNTYSL